VPLEDPIAFRDSGPPPGGPPGSGPSRPPFGAGPPGGGFRGPPGGPGGFSGPPGGGGGPRGPRDERSNEPRVNRRIRVREVRVIADDGSQLGIIPTDEALRRAEEKGLDLVEVQPMARPPVCKIMDYGKFKYEQKRKAAEMKKKQKVIEVKEVKFRPKTGIHDFDTKVRHLREFLGEGDKAKVTIMFRGREIVHPEIGQDVLKRVAEAISDIAQVELAPRMEGRSMFMVVAPGKASGKPRPMGIVSPPPGVRPQGPMTGPMGPSGPVTGPTGPVTGPTGLTAAPTGPAPTGPAPTGAAPTGPAPTGAAPTGTDKKS
jgi:translation initiation factor IF-3